jgi:hypothetical protein
MFSYRAAVLQTHVTEQQENSISMRLTFIEWEGGWAKRFLSTVQHKE